MSMRSSLLALLPLSTKTYYGTTDDEGKQVCTFSIGNGLFTAGQMN